MRVSELARASGVTAETIRHYTRKGLLLPQRDPHNGYQLYDDKAFSRLRFIQCFCALGFSLCEIKDILLQAEQGNSPCPKARDMLADHLPLIYSRIEDLQASVEWASQLLESCRGDMPGATSPQSPIRD